MPVPIEVLEGTKAQGDANAFERPEIVDVGVESGTPGVTGHGVQGRDERRVLGKGRAASPSRLVFRQAWPRRGDRQCHQSGHVIESVPPIPGR